jgi:hypothetical protein
MLRDLVQDLRYTALIIVKPQTVIAWHRQAFVGSGRGTVGTVPVDPARSRIRSDRGDARDSRGGDGTAITVAERL